MRFFLSDFQTLWYVQKIRNVYLVRRNSFFQKEREFHCLRKKWLTFHFPHHDFSTLAILIQHLPRKYFCMQKFSNHISGFRNCRRKVFSSPTYRVYVHFNQSKMHTFLNTRWRFKVTILPWSNLEIVVYWAAISWRAAGVSGTKYGTNTSSGL